MTSKASVHSFEALGTVCLNAITPDLVAWAEQNGVDLSAVEIDRTPRLGFRVGWSNDCGGGQDRVVIDVCEFDLVNPRPDGHAEERTVIRRFEMPKDQAIALTHLLLTGAKHCE